MATASSFHQRHISHSDRRAARHLLAVPAGVFAGVIILAACYIAYVLWPRWPDNPVAIDAPTLPVSVAGVAFNVPPAAVRMGVQRKPGAHERLDLVFLWPSLAPPETTSKAMAVTAEMPIEQIHPPDRIFVTIAGTNNTVAPPERRKTIYPRYLATNRSSSPAGLTVVAFRDGTPYQGEDLVFDAAAPEHFPCAARAQGPATSRAPAFTSGASTPPT